MFVISCHADTTQTHHRCTDEGDTYFGHMDNFAGVYAVMKAYFSGRFPHTGVRVALTHGEEVDYAGAYETKASLHKNDIVVVVDVTGVPTTRDFTIEKCADPAMAAWVRRALRGLSFELFPDCPDPIADQDETDVYREKLTRVCFLGIPCSGGDYNEVPVRCRKASLEAAAEALVRLAGRWREV